MIYVGQNSFRLTVATSIDLTGASSICLCYSSPTLSTGTFSATALVSTAGSMYHDFTSTDTLEAGLWVFWAHIKHADARISIGDPFTMTVRAEGSLT